MTFYDDKPTSAIQIAQQAALEQTRRQVREAAERRAAVEAARGKRPMEIPELSRNPAAGAKR
jgi:hypothetical protein